MAHKRSREEFEDHIRKHEARTKVNHAPDNRRSSQHADLVHAKLHDGTSERGSDHKRTDEDNDWQVARSSKKKKRRDEKLKEAEKEAKLGPRLRFDPDRAGISLRIKDLQSLVLYVLADDVAPSWVAVRNAKKIEQVVVLMIPGMDKEILEAACTQISAPEDTTRAAPECKEDPRQKDLNTAGSKDTNSGQEPLSGGISLSGCILPVKAPGDSKTGRMHSPLQTMLISPEPDAKKNGGRNSADVFQPVQTPLHRFVHTSEELVEAEFPVHPALFTNPSDAQFEKSRREGVGQSLSNGWVDSSVESSIPVFPENMTGAQQDITQGLTVYALDCEMVLTDDDKYSLARISILDWHGKVVLDQLVVPDLPIKNYYTQFSGITEAKLKGVTTRLSDIQERLLQLLTPSTVLIGHSLESDLNAMKMTHPFIVDTAMIYPHPRGLPLRSSLKFLANKYLKREIQKGGADGHDSVEDARAVLDLVRLKCEKGPTWGTLDANGESIFSRMARASHKTAIVEYGTPERGFGRHASIKIGCENDDEVMEGLIQVTGRESTADSEANSALVAFTWGRLRDMEAARGWNSNSNRYAAAVNKNDADAAAVAKPEEADKSNGSATPTHEDKLAQTAKATTDRLVRIYNSLAPATLVIVYPGTGDMREVLRLQEMQRQYRKEFKVKKWDELSVKWTDTEEQALKRAFNEARQGWALVCVK